MNAWNWFVSCHLVLFVVLFRQKGLLDEMFCRRFLPSERPPFPGRSHVGSLLSATETGRRGDGHPTRQSVICLRECALIPFKCLHSPQKSPLLSTVFQHWNFAWDSGTPFGIQASCSSSTEQLQRKNKFYGRKLVQFECVLFIQLQ